MVNSKSNPPLKPKEITSCPSDETDFPLAQNIRKILKPITGNNSYVISKIIQKYTILINSHINEVYKKVYNDVQNNTTTYIDKIYNNIITNIWDNDNNFEMRLFKENYINEDKLDVVKSIIAIIKIVLMCGVPIDLLSNIKEYNQYNLQTNIEKMTEIQKIYNHNLSILKLAIKIIIANDYTLNQPIWNNSNHRNKYLKYKAKYLALKKQLKL